MPRPVLRTTWIHLLALAVLLAGGPATAGPPEEDGTQAQDPEVARARETLIDLFASENIDRIDFQAETFEQAMYHLRTTADTILMRKPGDPEQLGLYLDRVAQVVEALNATDPRGMALTFGKDVKAVVIQNPSDARLLGETVADTVYLIKDHFREERVSYRDMARKVFGSVILEVTEGTLLLQYREGIQRVAGLPYGQQVRYFE